MTYLATSFDILFNCVDHERVINDVSNARAQ